MSCMQFKVNQLTISDHILEELSLLRRKKKKKNQTSLHILWFHHLWYKNIASCNGQNKYTSTSLRWFFSGIFSCRPVFQQPWSWPSSIPRVLFRIGPQRIFAGFIGLFLSPLNILFCLPQVTVTFRFTFYICAPLQAHPSIPGHCDGFTPKLSYRNTSPCSTHPLTRCEDDSEIVL